MDLSRSNWTLIRPASYKDGGTGARIDAFVGIEAAGVDPDKAQANYDAAVALANHLVDRKNAAKPYDFWAEKEQTKYEKEKEAGKKVGKSSPEDIGRDNHKVFVSVMEEWISEVKKAMPGLKTAITTAKTAQTEALDGFANAALKDLKAEFTTNCLAKLVKIAKAAKEAEGKARDKLIELADALVLQQGKKYDIYTTNAGFLALAIKAFVKEHKIKPDVTNFSNGTWGDKMAEHVAEAGKMLKKIKE